MCRTPLLIRAAHVLLAADEDEEDLEVEDAEYELVPGRAARFRAAFQALVGKHVPAGGLDSLRILGCCPVTNAKHQQRLAAWQRPATTVTLPLLSCAIEGQKASCGTLRAVVSNAEEDPEWAISVLWCFAWSMLSMHFCTCCNDLL